MSLLLMIVALVSGIDTMPDRLPGSDLSVAEAEKQARYIVEAKILHLDEWQPARFGWRVYLRAAIEPLRVLQGPADAAMAMREVSLLLQEDEAVPAKRGVYLLYIKRVNQAFEIFKVTKVPDRLPGSDVSVAEAEKKALYIVEAKILHLGKRRAALGGTGLLYLQTLIEPLKEIKGGWVLLGRSGRWTSSSLR
ncbi:MAG: hypothetical protein IRY99_25470, partial [Isosphaeraceae bacterium]|nr:hypothetical protein [Isosphaeraceae bacterium]